ncbi:hypothetical protein INT44_002935 [Umbelopsis vinacea]|uniref:Uncharacterized protein n=1 Tax=Umbelopsis vinacea TaxID=44442 RepID=A0A8H7Q7T2_9FUNG|nr:hypothetical protein INT44_002935 [Umbelopsis vinacea]KAI9290094.1 hypothetical protein BC943DRAFT_355920 [Umbelopsis sp. AD052]
MSYHQTIDEHKPTCIVHPLSASETRKPSVSFDLSNLPEKSTTTEPIVFTQDEADQDSSPIDISGQIVPDNILVALLDRDNEMKELVSRNKVFFSMLESHLHASWSDFQKLLFARREQVPDAEWIQDISEYLEHAPVLLEKFKELVGYEEYLFDSDSYEEDDEEWSRHGSYDESTFENVDITLIRNYPSKLTAFQESYPQFFINAKRCFTPPDGESQATFEEFEKLLFCSRRDIDDEEWEKRIYGMLDNWPNLLAQLKEIIAYEVDCEDGGIEEGS